VAQLASDLRTAGGEGVGFFYYSGHGGSAESAGMRANYLIPAKSPITGAEQLPILGVAVNSIVDTLGASDAKAVFIVSDACRNTLPFTSSKGGAADKGMVRVPRKRGLFISFATADGATTPDDGLFSKALSKRLAQKGLSADRAFTLALREVSAARPGNAMPFTADGLTEDICLAGCEAPAGAPVRSEGADYVSTVSKNTVDAYIDFIQTYPNSPLLATAQEAMVKLFYQEDPSAAKYLGEDDNIVGPVVILEAMHHAAEMASLRNEMDSAVGLFQISCQSGLGKSCTSIAPLIQQGYMDSEIAEDDGTVDPAMRDEIVTVVYQGGCYMDDPDACAWLEANGKPLVPEDPDILAELAALKPSD